MKKIFLILSLVLVFCGCGKSENKLIKLDNYFEKDNQNVYYFFSDNTNLKIEDADVKTFEVLGNGYAKDKNNVYWTSSRIKNADIKTFEVIKDEVEYAKDKNYVYSKWIPVKNVINPETFEFIENSIYAKDKNKIYYRGGQGELGIVENANPDTFKTIKLNNEYSHFGQDEKNLYYDGNLLKNVDYNSFKMLSKNYVVDKDNLYYFYHHYFFSGDGKVEFKNNVKPNLQSLEYLGDNLFKDDEFIYDHSYFGYEGKNHLVRMNGFDVNTFKVFNRYYISDKNGIYYLECVMKFDCISKAIKNADLNTFEIISGEWARDKNNCYFGGNLEEMKGCEVLKTKING